VHNTITQFFFLEEEDVQEDEDVWVLLVGEDAAAGWGLVTGVGAGPGLVIAGLLERGTNCSCTSCNCFHWFSSRCWTWTILSIHKNKRAFRNNYKMP
jgi:hypothetical protein